jgi:large subunit ribosomal protein L4
MATRKNSETRASPKAADASHPAKDGDGAPTAPPAKLLSGESVGTRDIDLAAFGDLRRPRLLKQVVVAYQANARQGTHSTKTRAETSYSGKKPWAQKHTGNARAGDRNSPLWRHGGTIHGPRPRDHRHHTPRRMLREALRSALLGKIQDGEVSFVERFELEKPSTKAAARRLGALGALRGATVVLEKNRDVLYRSFRNLPDCDVVQAFQLNALHVLKRRNLVFVGGAWSEVEARVRGEAPAGAAGAGKAE